MGTTNLHCPKCGTALTSSTLEGLCPACVVQVMREVPTIAGTIETTGDRIGRYKLLQKIGEGGCGAVYMAEQEEPVRRRVALKVIKLGMDTAQVVARFEAERQALALMDHPNIAKVFDAGATDIGRPYFVMELVRGIKITDYCDQNNLTPKQRLDLFIQVCHAVQHAHQKGIIHRDIKPSNVLVAQDDRAPIPKVIDFGIAKATTDQRLTDKTLFTAAEQFIGTPAYMSPEQADLSGVDIDTRSDIYSLGVLLYELLTGRTPFDAKVLWASGLDAMRRTIREIEPPRPSTRLSLDLVAAADAGPAPDESGASVRSRLRLKETVALLKGDLDWIVMKCLEKDRRRRYETANALAADLTRHLNSEPVMARPPSATYRLHRAFRRNKLAFVASGSVMLALVSGTAVSLWQASVATQTRRTAQHEAYLAKMNSAQAAWEENNVSRVGELLKETAAAPGRGFEWYYWQRQLHLEVLTLRGHGGPILAVAYSPVDSRLITGSADHTAKIWDANTGKELLQLLGHTAPVKSLAWSSDGRHIVTGGWDGTARIWDSLSGSNLVTWKAHQDGVFSLALSADGERLVTGGQDQTAKVWDMRTQDVLTTFRGHTNAVWAVALSADGQRAASGSWDHTAKVWSTVSGEELLTLPGHRGAVFAVAFSPDNQRIVTGAQDHRVRVWDAATGAIVHTLKGHGAAVFAVGYSRDGTQIITSSDDQTARLWSATDGEELRVFKGHGSRIGSVSLSPDGSRIVTGGGALRFSPEGEYVGTNVGDDETAKVWEAAGNRDVLILEGHKGEVVSVNFSNDGRWIVSGGWDGTARIWNVQTGEEATQLRPGGRKIYAAFSPDSQRIVTGSDDCMANVLNLAGGRELTLRGHTARVFYVTVSPDGQRIATAGWDGNAKLWDARTGENLHTLSDGGGLVYSVAFSPDGLRLVTASGDGPGKVTVWSVTSGNALISFQQSDKVWSPAFSPDGRRIVTGGLGLIARVWEASTGRELLSLKGHTEHTQAARFSPDGQRIVTASFDQTAKLWDAMTGTELLSFKGHRDSIYAVAFSPDGLRIATASGDKTIRVWQAASKEQVAQWRREEQDLADNRAAQERERAAAAKRDRDFRDQDPGIKQWLVLAPIPFQGRDGAAALDQEQIPQEALLRPQAGQRAIIGRDALIWRAVRPTKHLIDFNRLGAKETDFCVAYAVTYIVSDSPQTGLVMRVGSDDQAKVFLNGREIYRHTQAYSWELDRDHVPNVELNAGLNVLVFKVVNESGDWGGSVRFTDTAGRPITGLRVTLDSNLKN